MPIQHNDAANLAQGVFTTITRAGSLSFLTDATVAAADTKAGLRAAIQAVKVHNDFDNIKQLLIRVIDLDPNITDANVLNLTTVAGLAQLTGLTSSVSTEILT